MGTDSEYVEMQIAAYDCSDAQQAYGDLDLNGLRVSVHSLPMFHAMEVLQIGSTVRALSHTPDS